MLSDGGEAASITMSKIIEDMGAWWLNLCANHVGHVPVRPGLDSSLWFKATRQSLSSKPNFLSLFYYVKINNITTVW